MSKLFLAAAALLAILLATSSAFISKTYLKKYTVYGVPDSLAYVSEQYWESAYTAKIPDQVEVQINPITEEASPFVGEQALADFAASCQSAIVRVCLLSVEKTNGIVTDIIDVLPGMFQGF